MAAWQRGEGIGAFVEVDAQGSMRRASNASWDMSAYRPRMPEYDAVTWVGIGLAVFANLLIAVSPIPRAPLPSQSAWVFAAKVQI